MTEELTAKQPKPAASERFTNAVIREFGNNISGATDVTEYQRYLIQGYFITIDRTLETMEERRIDKNNSNKDAVNKVDNATLRQLLVLRYVRFMTWDKIAKEMNYEERQIYRLHRQALKVIGKFIHIGQ